MIQFILIGNINLLSRLTFDCQSLRGSLVSIHYLTPTEGLNNHKVPTVVPRFEGLNIVSMGKPLLNLYLCDTFIIFVS